MKFAVLVLLSLVASSRASAVELRLESVSAVSPGGSVKLMVDSKASFSFDPDTGTLESPGIWTALLAVGPRKSMNIRYSHKVEGMRVTADKRLVIKSYECVEGTLGSTVGLSFCGSYQFGANALDDGGFGDDVRIGEPRSLLGYLVGGMDWDGETLVLSLVSGDPAQPDADPGKSLELVFSAAGS